MINPHPPTPAHGYVLHRLVRAGAQPDRGLWGRVLGPDGRYALELMCIYNVTCAQHTLARANGDFSVLARFLHHLDPDVTLWTLTPDDVSDAYRQYLRSVLHTTVRRYADGRYTVTGPRTSEAQRLHDALRRAFDILTTVGPYRHPHPLRDPERLRAMQQFNERPDRRGQRQPWVRPHDRVYTFRPPQHRQVIPHDFIEQVRAAGTAVPWHHPGRLVTELLIDSGARTFEVAEASIASWADWQFGAALQVRNKGAGSDRVKVIQISDASAQWLRRWFCEQRPTLDPHAPAFTGWARGRPYTPEHYVKFAHAARLDLEDLPLMLTSVGTRYTAHQYRQAYWYPVVRAAGVSGRPHHLRHAFICRELRQITVTTPYGSPEQHRQEKLLGDYMGWSEQPQAREAMLRTYGKPVRDAALLRARSTLTHTQDTHLSLVHPSDPVPPPHAARLHAAARGRS